MLIDFLVYQFLCIEIIRAVPYKTLWAFVVWSATLSYTLLTKQAPTTPEVDLRQKCGSRHSSKFRSFWLASPDLTTFVDPDDLLAPNHTTATPTPTPTPTPFGYGVRVRVRVRVRQVGTRGYGYGMGLWGLWGLLGLLGRLLGMVLTQQGSYSVQKAVHTVPKGPQGLVLSATEGTANFNLIDFTFYVKIMIFYLLCYCRRSARDYRAKYNRFD